MARVSTLGKEGGTAGHYGNFVSNAADPFGLLGGDDGEDKTPLAPSAVNRFRGAGGAWQRHEAKQTPEQLLAEYNNYRTAAQLGGSSEFAGPSSARASRVSAQRANALKILLGNAGTEIPDNNTQLTESGLPDYSSISRGANTLRQLSHKTGKGAQYRERTQRYIQGMEREQNYADYQKNVDPVLSDISSQLQDLLSHPAIGGEEYNRLRSNITTNAGLAETSRLRRVAAVLGQRGLDVSSPTGAILAARAERETDQTLNDSLREFDLNTDEFNRTDRQRNLGLASQAIATRVGARSAALSGDSAKMFQVQENVGSLVAAIAQQQQLKDLYDKMYSQDNKGGWQGAASGAVSGAAAGAPLGPYGAAGGAIIGGAAGYFA